MPVRLLKQYNGQAANTLYWGPDEDMLRATGVADDRVMLASDYQQSARIVTAASATVTRNALVYLMNSGSAQVLTLDKTGHLDPGAVITVIQQGAGATTITPASGVTINTALSSLITKGQYNVAQLVKTTAADTWIAFGGLGG